MSDTTQFVSTQWLAAQLDAPNLSVVDGSWYLPQMGRDARAEYETGHIPGAVHFPIDEIADTTTDLPHMLADPNTFCTAVGDLGISHDDTIVIYDGAGLFSAPRVWWTFKVMGIKNVRILDGGFPKWLSEGRPTASGVVQAKPRQFISTPVVDAAATAAEVQHSANDVQIVDMRPEARFLGDAAEPRPGLRSGRIPGSLNLPFQSLIKDNRLRPIFELVTAIENAGIDVSKPVISSCGSGVTAAFLNLALVEIGVQSLRLYDGSWAEWGADADFPIETG